jgi:hypothetical protein
VIKWRWMRWSGPVAHMGVMNAYKILVIKPEGKRALRRTRHRWEDNIRMSLRGIGWEGVDWIHLAEDRDQWQTVVNTVMNFQVPQKAGNFLTSRVTVSFSRRTLLHGISYFSRFRPPRKHTPSQLQRSVSLHLQGTSEHSNEPLSYIEGGEFLD